MNSTGFPLHDLRFLVATKMYSKNESGLGVMRQLLTSLIIT